jgi:type II secretion system protein H
MQPVLQEPHRRSIQQGFTLLEIMVVIVIIGIVVTGAILSLGATGTDSALQRERDRLSDLMAYGRERGAMLTLEYGIRCGQHGYRFVFFDNRLNQWRPETVDDTMRLRQLPSGLQLILSVEGHDIVLDDKALQFNSDPVVPTGGTLSDLKSILSGGSSSSSGGASGANNANNPLTTPGSSGGLSAASSGGGLGGGSSSGGLGTNVNDNTPQIMLFSNGDTNSFVLTIARPDANHSATLQSNEDGKIQVGDIVEVKQK